jgi:hypothetical protein
MIKKIIIALIVVLTLSDSYAQAGKRRQQMEDKIKSLQIAFITERLSLTPTESEKFWPIFNQMEAEKTALLNEKNNDASENVSEKDAQLVINKHFEIKEKEIAIEKKYVEKLKAALPSSKIAKLLNVQRQFRQEIMSTIINKAKGRRGLE